MQSRVTMVFKDEDGDEVDLDSEESWQMLTRMDIKLKVICTKME
jgi:hypothetical protein